MIRVELRVVTMVVEPQVVITKDNVTIKVDAVVYFMVKDPVKAVLQVADTSSNHSDALTTLRSVLDNRTSTSSFSSGIRSTNA